MLTIATVTPCWALETYPSGYFTLDSGENLEQLHCYLLRFTKIIIIFIVTNAKAAIAGTSSRMLVNS